ncbi:MAG: gamma-glutamyltransferase [Candidatus Eremiobacteraeota bacterium]|nr:gamma-glutamyltransferase [Candidatus Eremiobacteraeota bacterium]
MVVTEQRYASQVGLDVLKAGGNAVDAAVAVGYALAVVDPCCGNLGGGGFMVLRMHDGRARTIDFREVAPSHATRDMFLDRFGNPVPDRSRKGWLAIGVPGSVMGFERARTEYGTMSRSRLMAGAYRLAQDGYTIAPGDLIPFAGTAADGYGGFGAGRIPVVGELWKQPDLARSLALISLRGTDAFYRGPIAAAIVKASRAHGGILTMQDFARYTAIDRDALRCKSGRFELIGMPPPSSGATTLCQIAHILDPYVFHSWHDVRETHYVIEAERRAYADRNAYLGDPDFVKNPVAQLTSPAYAAKLRATILPKRATPSSQVHPGLNIDIREGSNTSHYSIVDKHGNAVAVTYTINDWFGAGVIAPGTGFFLNDGMDDFTAKPGAPNMYGLVQGIRNDIVPGKRALSSMSPTIVLRDGKLAMLTGSPGGSRIITTVLETILNVFDFGMNAQQAVDAPRIHMQWEPDEIQYEPGALAQAQISALEANGYAFHRISAWGSAQAIVIDPVTGMLYGGSDRRHPAGAALGY